MVVHRDSGGNGRGGDGPFLGRWLFGRRLIVLAVAIALLVLAGAGSWWYAAGRYASIPVVAGDTVADATTALTVNGFKVGGELQQDSNSVPKGEVVGTSPSGRAVKGATISLEISAGPYHSVVPDVKNMTQAAAQAALSAVHLPFYIDKVGSTQPVGTVLGTRPKAGTS